MNEAKKHSLFRSAVEGTVFMSASQFLQKLLGFLASFVVLAHVDPYTFGIWQLLLSMLTGFTLLTFSSLAGVFVADISHELGLNKKNQALHIVSRAAVMFLFAGVFSGAALAVFAPVITHVSGLQLTPYLLLLSIVLAVSGLRQIGTVIFQSYLRPVHALVFQGINSLVYFIGIVTLLPALQWGLWGLVTAYVIASIAPLCIYGPYLIKILYRAFLAEPDAAYGIFKSVWERGKFILGNDYVTTAIGSLWPWIVGYYIGIEEVGILSIAILLLSQSASLIPINYVLRALLPRMSHENQRMNEWLSRSMKYSLWSNVAMGVGFFVAGSIIFPMLFPKYASALPVFFWLLLATPQRAAGTVLTEWFYAMKEQKLLFWYTVIPKITAFIFLIPLLKLFGIAGFVIWYIVSSDSVLVSRIRYIRQQTGLSISLKDMFTIDARDRDLVSKIVTNALSRTVGRRF